MVTRGARAVVLGDGLRASGTARKRSDEPNALRATAFVESAVRCPIGLPHSPQFRLRCAWPPQQRGVGLSKLLCEGPHISRVRPGREQSAQAMYASGLAEDATNATADDVINTDGGGGGDDEGGAFDDAELRAVLMADPRLAPILSNPREYRAQVLVSEVCHQQTDPMKQAAAVETAPPTEDASGASGSRAGAPSARVRPYISIAYMLRLAVRRCVAQHS